MVKARDHIEASTRCYIVLINVLITRYVYTILEHGVDKHRFLARPEGFAGKRRRNQGYDGQPFHNQHRTRGSCRLPRGCTPRILIRLCTSKLSTVTQGSVQYVGAVSGNEHDYTGVAIEASYLRELLTGGTRPRRV
jgi:hypothetical protein